MKHLFLLSLLFLATGCYSTPTPTPYALQQYPATWTPAPTATNTPPGPTATLVIQHTPGAIATRDPNLRVLPSVPHNGIGLWMQVNAKTPKPARDLAANVQVLITDGSGNTVREANQMVVLSTATLTQTEPLSQNYNGILLQSNAVTNDDALAKLRDAIKPRFVLITAPISDTATAQTNRADGIVLTGFLRNANMSPDQFPDEGAWKNAVDTLVAQSANSNRVVLVSTDFTSGEQDAFSQQWFDFAFASFLLGANNTHTFFRLPDQTAQAVNLSQANLNLGTPSASAFKANGIYQRRFTHGLVLVNSTNDKHILALSNPYQNSVNQTITQFEMLPHTGIILTRAE